MREEKKHTKEEKPYTQKARNREMDDEEKQTARKGRLCYHGVQRKTSCLQPIHQLPATKFCVSQSFLLPLYLSPSAFLPLFVISLDVAGV